MLTSVLVAWLLAAPPAPNQAASGVGKKVTVSLKSASVQQVLDVIAEVSRFNVVLFDEPAVRKHVFDLEVKDKPWDTLLSEVLKTSGLFKMEQANVIYVGTEARLKARKPYGGTNKRVSLELSGARVSDAVAALTVTGRVELSPMNGGSLQTRKVRNLPTDFIASLLSEVSGASADAPADVPPLGLPEGDPKCAAGDVAVKTLQLTAVSTGTADPAAIARAPDGRTFLLLYKGCVGLEAEAVRHIRRDEVVTSSGWVLKLGAPATRAPSSPPVDEKLEDE